MAWHNYVMADTLPFIIQSQLWYGTSLCNLKHVKEATALMEDAENKARKYQDPDLIEMALSEVGNAYLWQKEYQKAKKEYTDLEKRVGLSNMTEHDLRLYLYSLVHLGEYNDTTEMVAKQLEKIVGNTKVNHEYFLHRNDYKMAFEAMKGMYDSLNNDLSARRINDTNLLLASYNQEKIKQTTLELKVLQREKFWITVTSILVIGFIIIISYFFIQRKKLKIRSLINETAILTQEYHFLLESQKSINYSSDDHCSDKKETVNNAVNDNPGATECRGNEKEIVNIEENSEFENSPENDIIGSPESDKDNDALLPTKKKQNADNSYSDESVIHSLFLSTIERLDSLHHQYLKGYAKQEDILKIMQCEINKLRNDNKFISKLEELINRDTDGILFEVYESIGKMKFDQRKLLIYLYYGLTTNMICLLLEIEPNGLYNRKNRLLNKIKASVSERKSILINKLRRNYT